MSDGALAPEWMTTPEPAVCPCCRVGVRRHGETFATKTLRATTVAVRRVLLTDDVASAPGLLQRFDPRVKLVAGGALLIAASFVHSSLVLVGMWVATVALAAASGLPVRWFVARLLPALGFTVLVVVPAAFTAGVGTAAVIVARVAVSTSIVALVTLTTRWNDLLGALRWARVPRVFVVVLAMAYRYVLGLLDVVTDMYQARVARTVRRGDRRGDRGFVAASAGAAFGKAHALSTEVHMSMVSRGYVGDVRSLGVRRDG